MAHIQNGKKKKRDEAKAHRVTSSSITNKMNKAGTFPFLFLFFFSAYYCGDQWWRNIITSVIVGQLNKSWNKNSNTRAVDDIFNQCLVTVGSGGVEDGV